MNRPTNGGKAAARTIKVDALARVEGEGALYVRIKDGAVKDIKFRIFEPPRFFEALLRGRMFSDAPDITARICGICPVAYILGASHAMEEALGIECSAPIRDLRRLLYCGEWIQSHVLHAAMLHAPDFLGLDDALQLAKTNREVVEKALALKKLGNDILEVIGGRAVHPVNTRVGGFFRAPSKGDIRALGDRLRWGADAAQDLALLFGGFDFPDYEYDYTCVSLRHPDVYAIEAGRLVSNRGLDIPLAEFFDHFGETHVAHSNALHGVMRNETGPYLVGPIARYNNNQHQLSERARQVAKDAGLNPVCRNPYRSIVVRMVETLYACEEGVRLAEAYEPPAPPAAETVPGPGVGYGCTEAPRGICFHHYSLDDDGRIVTAQIVPPTSQNQPQIERDLLGVVETNLDLADEDLKWRCEQTIRNYDPCISCATHFLDLRVDRD